MCCARRLRWARCATCAILHDKILIHIHIMSIANTNTELEADVTHASHQLTMPQWYTALGLVPVMCAVDLDNGQPETISIGIEVINIFGLIYSSRTMLTGPMCYGPHSAKKQRTH